MSKIQNKDKIFVSYIDVIDDVSHQSLSVICSTKGLRARMHDRTAKETFFFVAEGFFFVTVEDGSPVTIHEV